MNRILVIDNYDSFVYNIVQYLGELGANIIIRRNDIALADAIEIKPDKIVLSPGPGHPSDSKVTLDILRNMSKDIPTLGVCLGHQAIAQVYGGEVVAADKLLHGKTSLVYHDGEGIFKDVLNPISATRYHSLIVRRDNIPDSLTISAETKSKEIMGIRHTDYPIFGLQFHPESILTQNGMQILNNFLEV